MNNQTSMYTMIQVKFKWWKLYSNLRVCSVLSRFSTPLTHDNLHDANSRINSPKPSTSTEVFSPEIVKPKALPRMTTNERSSKKNLQYTQIHQKKEAQGKEGKRKLKLKKSIKIWLKKNNEMTRRAKVSSNDDKDEDH